MSLSHRKRKDNSVVKKKDVQCRMSFICTASTAPREEAGVPHARLSHTVFSQLRI